LRPGFLLANESCPVNPGLKSETWATHSESEVFSLGHALKV
jgi:hypothetical protein